MSPPALPMTTSAPAICGAPVLEYSPCSPLSVSTSQIFAPVLASNANSWAFVEATYTLPFQTATPRLTTSQHAARPIAALFSGSNTQIGLPVAASSAYTTPRLPDVYMTPSTTSAVATHREPLSRFLRRVRNPCLINITVALLDGTRGTE